MSDKQKSASIVSITHRKVLLIGSLLLVHLLGTWVIVPSAAAQSSGTTAVSQDGGDDGIDRSAFGGPDATPNRIASDRQPGAPLIKTDFTDSYWKWKGEFLEEYGLAFGAEYNSTILTASDSLDADHAKGIRSPSAPPGGRRHGCTCLSAGSRRTGRAQKTSLEDDLQSRSGIEVTR